MKMGEFTKRVRSDAIAGPLRRAFTPDRWNRAFGDLPAPDAEDQDIHAAGLVLHEKLGTIRSILKLSSSDEISATTKLRAFLALANYDFFVTRDKTGLAIERFMTERAAVSQELYDMEEMAAVKLSLPGGAAWMPNEVVEGIVDGIELPIRVVMQAKPDLAGNPRMNRIQWDEAIRELNLGVLYRFAVDLWDDCLWNSYKMIDTGPVKVFLPREIDVLRSYRTGLARRASLSMGFNIQATQFQREAFAQGMRLKFRDVCGIERRGKRQVIKVAKQGVSTGILEQLSILRTHAAEPYYGELLEERLEALHGLTLSTLMDAWTFISRAAQMLAKSIGEKHTQNVGEDRVHAWMPEYAPTLQTGALEDALAIAAGINKAEARRIVDFFTFRGMAGQELWAQPLVPVGPDKVVPVFAAVASPNLRRLVDVWMRQTGVDLARRGPAFETHIQELVIDAIQSSEVLSPVAACITGDYTFRPSGSRDEQIDLIFSIGNTVFVAEAKCILEPTDAKGLAMHRKTVLGAAEQALRKAKAVEDNRIQFIEDASRFGMTLSEDFKVEPLVIVSTSTHVGIAALTVPVIDEHILGRFMDGELEDIAYQPGDPASSKRFKTRFYSNAAEAEERAPGYFASPPQMKRFIDGLRVRVVPLYAADERDWAGQVVTMECVAGGVPLSLQEQARSAIKGDPTTSITHERYVDVP
ncbi:hypothetical protein ABB25_12990 [Stenotrophomonas koreensis]|uniref:NERD domain-containing protein n=1 Tax=Stenotrophomonas koreensis TaxID=266128 RepID=A0A0R0BM54_9GAMM|nr:hypothetical protein [Stenotrophomonas koreensis]KRG54990.1 hypothetical protein ABB25_12990 [Stenotrophomonas koreensis]